MKRRIEIIRETLRGLPVWEVPPAGRMACAVCVRDLLNGSGA